MTVTTTPIDEGEVPIVLLPEAFAFSSEIVCVRRDGDAVSLESIEDDQGEAGPGGP